MLRVAPKAVATLRPDSGLFRSCSSSFSFPGLAWNENATIIAAIYLSGANEDDVGGVYPRSLGGWETKDEGHQYSMLHRFPR